MAPRRTLRRPRLLLPALLALLAPVLAVAPAGATVDPGPEPDAGPRTMVALGDSFAAAPLVPVPVAEPLGCLRASMNYAHQVAQALSLELTDATCSGATTVDMWETHGVSPDAELVELLGLLGLTDLLAPLLGDLHPGNPPQLDALRPDTDVVTLQIGGNDIGFAGIAITCLQAALTGARCAPEVEADRPFDRIAETAPKIQAVLEEIHRRSPDADIYVLGYPGIFKIGDTAACPAMAVGEEDARYLRSIHEALNGMIRSTAEDPDAGYAGAARYVDVYGPSAGHTACDLPLVRWVEPFVPVNLAAPVHPNLGGMTAIGRILAEEIAPGAATGPSPLVRLTLRIELGRARS